MPKTPLNHAYMIVPLKGAVFSLIWTCRALCVLVLITSAVQAQAPDNDDDAPPPPLTEYMGRPVAPTMTYHGAAWLTRENREQEEHCKTLLKALHIKPGMTVCDMGCGNGYYTLPIARLVGKRGRMLAVDIQPEMLHLLDIRAKEAGVTNLEPIQSSVVDPKLPEASCDMILLVDVYHEFSYPKQMLKAMRQALKPSGRIVLVEFRLEDPEVPIKLEHKMSKAQLMKELPANGFRLAEEFEKLPWQHVMFFERDDAPNAAVGDDSSERRGTVGKRKGK